MFSVYALIIIGAVFIAVLFILGSIKQFGYKQPNQIEQPENGFSVLPENRPLVKSPKNMNTPQSPSHRPSSPSRVPRSDYPTSSKPQNPSHAHPKLPSNENTLFTKPPVATKPHYRPDSPRPTTPIDNRPKTPIDARRPTTPKPDDDKEQVKPKVTQRDVSEINRKQFKTYAHLGAAEKSVIAHPKTIAIEVPKSELQPLIDMMKKKGDDEGTERYVVAYFNKANDKNLNTASERFIRKSFKIALEGTDTFRFARFLINQRDDIYRLEVHDYTPYIEQNSPKYNPINHAISSDRSFWLDVDAKLYHKSEEIKANRLSILVPGISMEKRNADGH